VLRIVESELEHDEIRNARAAVTMRICRVVFIVSLIRLGRSTRVCLQHGTPGSFLEKAQRRGIEIPFATESIGWKGLKFRHRNVTAL
jgi:hypothetical protein